MRKIFVILITMILLGMTGCSLGKTSVSKSGQAKYDTKIVRFEIEPNEGCPRYNAIVSITNTGECNLSTGFAIFDVEDKDGKLISTETAMTSVRLLKPRETGYYYVERVELPTDTDTAKNYTLKFHEEGVKKTDVDLTDFETKEDFIAGNDYGKIIGIVELTDTTFNGDIEVSYFCYNKDDELVAVASNIIGAVQNSSNSFEVLSYAAFGRTDIAKYKVQARNVE